MNKNTNKFNPLFFKYCKKGELEQVKQLLTSIDLNEHTLSLGFLISCEYNHLNIVQFLFNSPNVKQYVNIHYDYDYGFNMACRTDTDDLIQYLIFEQNIPLTTSILNFLECSPYFYQNTQKREHIKKMFSQRDLKNQLEDNLHLLDIQSHDNPHLNTHSNIHHKTPLKGKI